MGDAGVGDDEVEPAGLGDEALDRRLHLLAVADVGGQGDRARPQIRDVEPRPARRTPTAAPRPASARAISRPMPREAPVTSARVVASIRMKAGGYAQEHVA